MDNLKERLRGTPLGEDAADRIAELEAELAGMIAVAYARGATDLVKRKYPEMYADLAGSYGE